MQIRIKRHLAALLAAALLPVPALAGEWSGSATLASQYVSRGFQQTWGEPTLQGSLDYDWGNGFTAGAWASGVSDRVFEGGSSEVDLYVGYEKSVGDFTYGLTAYHYRYPGARMSAVDESYNYGELIPSIGWKMVTLSYAYTWSRDYNGYNSRTLSEDGDRHSRGSGYVDLSVDVPLGEATVLKLHAGRQRVRNFSAYDWSDARIGIEHAFGADWIASGGYTRGWFKDGIYDEYTTGVPDRNGVVHTTNPLDGAWVFAVTRNF